MAHTRLYRDGNLILEDFPVEQISDHLEEDDRSVVWLDLCDPTEDDFAMVREEFGLHALAVEDALHKNQRPKLDRYDSHLFLSAYAVHLDDPSGELALNEVAAFITDRALITVHNDDRLDTKALRARWSDNADLAKHGVSYLVHGLLDFLVDGHFATVQELDTAIEDLEDLLFDEDGDQVRAVQRRCFELRKSLVVLRRVVLPMREVVNTLMRPTTHIVAEAMLPYYQDVFDHVLRATEWTESLRDLVTTVMETNLTVQSNRMNLIMKRSPAGRPLSPYPPPSPASTARTSPTPASARSTASSNPPSSPSPSPASSTWSSAAKTGCRTAHRQPCLNQVPRYPTGAGGAIDSPGANRN